MLEIDECVIFFFFVFFFNDTATTEIYTLSLHDALPILLDPQPENAKRIKLDSPLLFKSELEAIKNSDFSTAELSTLFAIANGPSGLKSAVESLQLAASEAVESGSKIIILSDRISSENSTRENGSAVNSEYTYIPPLMAVGAVHHYLISQGLRMQVSLVVDTAQCWSTHHYACLLGYGVDAICPYMALDTVFTR